jgi:glutamate dehydrogenase
VSTTEERAAPGGDVYDLLAERAGRGRRDAVCEFARGYLRRVDPEGADAERLAHEVLGAFEFASARGRAEVAVRAFNPVLERDGYAPAGSVIETNTPDLDFLVDSLTAEVHARDLTIARVVHPILGVQRDSEGLITAVEPASRAERRESVIHIDLDDRLNPEELADLEDAARDVLEQVRRVVGDFEPMLEAVERMGDLAQEASQDHPPEVVEEAVAFLTWLRRAHFIFLGYRDSGGAALGLYRRAEGVEGDDAPGEGLLTVAKTNELSPVHRRVRMDVVRVGAGEREARVIGLFTSRALSEPAMETPLLERKLARVLDAEELIEGSHDQKAAVTLFESFPRDELFAWSESELRRAIGVLLGVHGERVRLMTCSAQDGYGASVVAAIPRVRYSPELRASLADLVGRRLGTDSVSAHEVLGEDDYMRVHLGAHVSRGGVGALDEAELEREVTVLARTWDDDLRDRLVRELGDERGRMLAARWGRRLPESYKAATDPDIAVDDVQGFERLLVGGEDFVVALHEDSGTRTRVSLFKRGDKVELSSVMPILEDLGLHVIEERATRLESGADAWLQDFGVLGPEGEPLDLECSATRVAAVITAVWRGEAESDDLNQLVIDAGLDWTEVAVLRGYRKYRQRIGSRFTESYQNRVIVDNAPITAKLMRLFALRFDPRRDDDRGEGEAQLRAEIVEDLDAVASLDHDRILRNQLGLIEATVRTNAYSTTREALAFKLRSGDVPALPQPAPLFEIYVYSPEMEGIHLRGGQIARGGIRWSDRQDYRTEVFGLMRAQMVKNAVIVPTGAKGGFYLRGASSSFESVREQYVRYVSALLDLTDNLVDGEVVPPSGVRVLDEEDTYLVVAADKGTATFSDTANTVASERGFWLGDAFASGGSRGYDHKALGITARGAWESLKRHFRDLDLDPAEDRFTAVGIGDMSGDVFGNGLLLSDRYALVAAYDHRHVFIDPDPGDTEASWRERKRLFEEERSTWDGYDRDLISEGGGVWPRTAKSIPLSSQAREALGVDAEALPPNEVVQAILRAPVDVLWNGGIGTVVKASGESHEDALDRSSDHIRVDADQLRCRVVAEGGNLGFTHRARIEYSRAGGLINADFIDNSAGVDCSDHEVNLKILLGLAVSKGELDMEGRDALLAEATDGVAAHVLRGSFLQAQILAQEVRTSAARMWDYEDLMLMLENAGLLDREVEFLPAPDTMAERRRQGEGLERPELAVLVAHAKRHLTGALLESDLLDDPFLERDLVDYFPRPVVDRYGHLLAEHPLRRELLAMIEANLVVDCLGPTFASRQMAEVGASPDEVVRAFRVALAVTGATERWRAIERLGRGVELDAFWELVEGVDWLVEAVARWYLAHHLDVPMDKVAAAGRDGLERLARVLPDLGNEDWRAGREERAARLQEAGVPEELARAHSFQPGLAHAPDMVMVARSTGRPVEEVGETFYRIGDALRMEPLEARVLSIGGESRTQRWAARALLEELLTARRELAHRALVECPDDEPEQVVEAFLHRREAHLGRYESFLRSLSRDGQLDLAGLALALRSLRALVE